jgi:hypothetical protein
MTVINSSYGARKVSFEGGDPESGGGVLIRD